MIIRTSVNKSIFLISNISNFYLYLSIYRRYRYIQIYNHIDKYMCLYTFGYEN